MSTRSALAPERSTWATMARSLIWRTAPMPESSICCSPQTDTRITESCTTTITMATQTTALKFCSERRQTKFSAPSTKTAPSDRDEEVMRAEGLVRMKSFLELQHWQVLRMVAREEGLSSMTFEGISLGLWP